MTKCAVDTNILVYLYDASDDRKRQISESLLITSPVVSSQVISEFLNTAKRTLKLPKNEILTKAIQLFNKCEIIPINQTTLEKALVLIQRYDFQLFDSLIVASALQAGCTFLYSEDLQHNQFIDNRLRIINPFL